SGNCLGTRQNVETPGPYPKGDPRALPKRRPQGPTQKETPGPYPKGDPRALPKRRPQGSTQKETPGLYPKGDPRALCPCYLSLYQVMITYTASPWETNNFV
uniref:Uncharacterized protein n=1 Tax=Oncorhynchus tshawytscha TaxID=74940 RepID=A0AAZ3SIM7_ONCTS